MLTRDEAMAVLTDLIRQYGVQWTKDVPRSAWDTLAECNKVLTEEDRRDALRRVLYP